MKAVLYVEEAGIEDSYYFCLYFPEVALCCTSGRDGQVFNSTDKAAEYWLKKLVVAEFEVPFDIVARMYCYSRNFRLDDFRFADHHIWNNEEVKRAIHETRSKA